MAADWRPGLNTSCASCSSNWFGCSINIMKFFFSLLWNNIQTKWSKTFSNYMTSSGIHLPSSAITFPEVHFKFKHCPGNRQLASFLIRSLRCLFGEIPHTCLSVSHFLIPCLRSQRTLHLFMRDKKTNFSIFHFAFLQQENSKEIPFRIASCLFIRKSNAEKPI